MLVYSTARIQPKSWKKLYNNPESCRTVQFEREVVDKNTSDTHIKMESPVNTYKSEYLHEIKSPGYTSKLKKHTEYSWYYYEDKYSINKQRIIIHSSQQM